MLELVMTTMAIILQSGGNVQIVKNSMTKNHLIIGFIVNVKRIFVLCVIQNGLIIITNVNKRSILCFKKCISGIFLYIQIIYHSFFSEMEYFQRNTHDHYLTFLPLCTCVRLCCNFYHRCLWKFFLLLLLWKIIRICNLGYDSTLSLYWCFVSWTWYKSFVL